MFSFKLNKILQMKWTALTSKYIYIQRTCLEYVTYIQRIILYNNNNYNNNCVHSCCYIDNADICDIVVWLYINNGAYAVGESSDINS